MVATLCFAPLLCLSHPITALMSLIYLAVGGVLSATGRPFPRHTLMAAGAMAVLVLAGCLATSAFLSPSNPTIAALHATARYDYIDPIWMIGTLAAFPVLAALWFLLLAPGLESIGLRSRVVQPIVIIMAVAGLWFAANGTSLSPTCSPATAPRMCSPWRWRLPWQAPCCNGSTARADR